MVNLAQYPIIVDGVRLDTLAYGVTEHRPQVAATRPSDLIIPGADGVDPSLWDDTEPAYYGLTIHVRGRDDDGNLPGGQTSPLVLERNLDEILHLFRGSPHRLKDVRRQVAEDGTQRRALVKVQDVIEPEVSDLSASVAVSMMIPSGVWEDVATADWSGTAGAASGTDQVITPLAGATAPIHDAILLVEGPAANPVLTDPYTGATVTLGYSLAAGEFWRLNVGTWSSRTGTLTLASTDADGVDRAGVTFPSAGTARFLTLTPERTARDARRVRVRLSGSGFTAATRVSARARRKYLT